MGQRYIVITPAANEEAYIRKTLESMTRQTHLPAQWVIVNDGSTDSTGEIIGPYVAKHDWISLVDLPPKTERVRGGHVVRVFNRGLEAVTVDYDYIAKLDADLSFEPDYFAQLLIKFAEEPRLGIAGGECYEWDGERWQIEKTAPDHVRGATKLYRRTCFEEIGGLDAVNGWDSIDEWRAQMAGWSTRGYAELPVSHFRPTGAAERGRFGGKRKLGEFAYFLGYPWIVILARSAYRAFVDRPFLLAGAAIFLGYFASWLRRAPRFDDPDVLAYARKRHLRRLRPRIFSG